MTRDLAHVARAVCALVLAAALAHAQGAEPRVTARLSTGVAKLGEAITLQVVAENVAEADLEPAPPVPGLRIGALRGPFKQSSLSSVNGRVTQYVALTWSAEVRAGEAGEFTIPPLRVRIGTRVLESAPLTLTVVADLKGENLGFVEVLPSSPRVIDGQPFTLEVRFGWDARMRYNYAILSLPWWRQLEGTVENPLAPSGRAPSDVYAFVDGEPFEAFEELEPTTRDGAAFRTFRLRKSFTPTRPGTLDLSTSSLEFGRAVAREDFFALRRSLERVEQFFVRAEPLAVEVIPLPERDRPFDFGGAVGRFEVEARAEPRDVTAGDSIKLTVEWTGAGNLEFFEAPDPARQPAFDGFRVYGKTETRGVDRRTVVYDVAPLEPSVRAIPPLETPVFDPQAMRYERLATAPIAIHVRPLADAATLDAPEGPTRSARDLVDIDARASARAGPPRVPAAALLGALALAPALALAIRARVRRSGDPGAPAAKRRRRARKRLERELAAAPDARARFEAFCEFLGARSRESREAWVGRRVDGERAGALAPGLARELEGELAELERAAWSGEAREVDRERVLALADRLIAGGL